MAKMQQLNIEKRDLVGKKVSRLRKQGIIPANIFGNTIKSTAVQVEASTFTKLFSTVGETGLVELKLAGEKSGRPVLIVNVQVDPVTSNPLHIDFHQVSLKEKVTAAIPLELIGEAPAVAEQGGILVQTLSDITVEALPTDLPDKFELDITGLKEIGDSIQIEQLQYDKGIIELQIEPETTLVTIQAQQEEEAEEEPTPAEAETTVQGEAETPEAESSSEETSETA